MSNNVKQVAFWVVLFLLILALFNLFSGDKVTLSSRTIPYSDFISIVEKGEVSGATLDGEQIIFQTATQQYMTVKPQGVDVTPILLQNKVAIDAKPQEKNGLLSYVGTLLPFLFIIGIWLFFMNRMQGGGKGGAMGFGKSRAKLLTEKHGGKVPKSFEELEKLPGVGHKTASVVMSQGFGYPAFAVDTHIHRLSQRWGLTNGKNVIQTEKDLKRLFPKETWSKLHLQIIYYGREYCKARDCYGLTCKICSTCYPNRKKPIITKKA